MNENKETTVTDLSVHSWLIRSKGQRARRACEGNKSDNELASKNQHLLTNNKTYPLVYVHGCAE